MIGRLTLAAGAATCALAAFASPVHGATFGDPLAAAPNYDEGCTSCTLVNRLRSDGSTDPGAPFSGVLTSVDLHHRGSAAAGVGLLVLRPGNPADPNEHSFTDVGPRITADFPAFAGSQGTITTVPTRHPIQQGDRLGLINTASGFQYANLSGNPGQCMFMFTPHPPGTTQSYSDCGSGDAILLRGVVEPDADNDGFGDITQDRCPISAQAQGPCPNGFTAGSVKRNLQKGIATLTVTVPGPGTLTLAGGGVVPQRPQLRRPSSRAVTAAGPVSLKVKAKGGKKAKLNRTGEVKVRVSITYSPTDGVPNTLSRTVRLKKNVRP